MVKKLVGHYFTRLRQRVFFLLLLFTVVPLLVAGISFFLYSRDRAVDAATAQSTNYMNLTSNSLQFLLEDVSETSLDLIRSQTLRTTLTEEGGIRLFGGPSGAQYTLNEELSYTAASKRYIHSITLFDLEGDRLSTDSRRLVFGSALEAAGRKAGAATWHLLPAQVLPNVSHFLSHVRLVRDYREIRKSLGYLAINLDQSELVKLLQDGAPFASTRNYLVNQEGRIVSSGSGEYLGALLEDIIDQMEGPWVCKTDLGTFPFEVVQVSDRSEVIRPVRSIAVFLFLSLLGLAVIFSLFATWFSKRVVSPIIRLTALLRKVEENNYQITAPVDGEDEIAELSRQFNAMVNQIRTLFDEVYVAQIHERDAELRALQAQINPHFLHNTLNALYMNARLEDAPETGSLIKEFSSLMRFSMQTERPVVTLEEEINHAQSYLTLQQHRIGERLFHEWDIDEVDREQEVLRLILQPIVENAIVHGIETTEDQLQVRTRVYRRNGTVYYEVTDNGPGLSSEKPTDSGIGLRNVRERLELYFGNAYELTMLSSESGGTRVVVGQPDVKENYRV